MTIQSYELSESVVLKVAQNVMNMMLSGCDGEAFSLLKVQYAHCVMNLEKADSAGFWVAISVENGPDPLDITRCALDDVYGYDAFGKEIASFILWIIEGYIVQLEGTFYSDDVHDCDLENITLGYSPYVLCDKEKKRDIGYVNSLIKTRNML